MEDNFEMSKNKINFSLLCTCKNEMVDIKYLIESIKNVDYPKEKFEILFADDSNDATCNVIEKNLKNSGLNWKIVKCDNNGCCEARNKGFKKTRGNYVVFLTADTILTSEYLTLLDIYKRDNKIIMPESSCLLPNSKISIFEKYSQTCHRLIIENLKKKSILPLTSQGYCVSRKEAIEAGLINTPPKGSQNYCKDYTLVEKMLSRGDKYLFEKKLLVFHKQPDNFNQFFQEKMLRGKMSRRVLVYEKFRSKQFIFFRALLKLFIAIFLIPIRLIKVFYISKKFKDIDFNSVFLLIIIDSLAFFIGEAFG